MIISGYDGDVVIRNYAAECIRSAYSQALDQLKADERRLEEVEASVRTARSILEETRRKVANLAAALGHNM